MDAESRLIVMTRLTNAPVDVRELIPVMSAIAALLTALGAVDTLLADAGYFSAANVAHGEQHGITPLIARRRDPHYVPWYDRFADPGALPAEADAVTAHGSYAQDRGRSGSLWPAQAACGARVRDHQAGDAVQAVLVARTRQGRG